MEEERKTMLRDADAYIVNVFPNGGSSRDTSKARFFTSYGPAVIYARKMSNAHKSAIVQIEEVESIVNTIINEFDNFGEESRQQEFISGKLFRDGVEMENIVNPCIRHKDAGYTRDDYDAEEIEAIFVGINNGLTISDIAKQLNRNATCISRYLREQQITTIKK